jgi:hypothetical protein
MIHGFTVFGYRLITNTSLFPAILVQGEKLICGKKLPLLMPPHLYAKPCSNKLDGRGEC